MLVAMFLIFGVFCLPLCYGKSVPDAPCPFVMDVVETSKGIYIGTETSGVFQFDPTDNVWHSVKEIDFGALSGDSFLCSHEDLNEVKTPAHVYAMAQD